MVYSVENQELCPTFKRGDVISRLSRELELSSKTTHNQA
jgi:hypothetical protein